MLSTKSALPLFCLSFATNPSTGYDVNKQLQDFWSHQQTYREFNKLATKGLVTYVTQVNEGKPDAKVYIITNLGRQSVAELFPKLLAQSEMPRHMLAALTKAHEVGLVDDTTHFGFLDDLYEALEVKRGELTTALSEAENNHPFSTLMLYKDQIAANSALRSAVHKLIS